MDRLSIVIAHYNYGEYLVEAVHSALNLDWPDIEVVVVDDGSTDDSVSLLGRFEGRIKLVLQANQGQQSAASNGFNVSTGDAVIFLDSDDVLPRDLPRALDTALVRGVSKVQFQMQRIDAAGLPLGAPFPSYSPRPSAADIRTWFTLTSAYPTPPGSANAYPRWFLDLTIPRHAGVDEALDSTLLAAAPVLGDVVCVSGVTVGYRRHAGNSSELLSDDSRFAREVRRAQARWRFARDVSGEPLPDEVLRRSRELLQFRVAARRLSGRSPDLPPDGISALVRDAVGCLIAPGVDGWFRRIEIVGFSVAVLVLPLPVVRRLLRMRFGGGRHATRGRGEKGS